MIHLDTNYLIGLAVKGSRAASAVRGWLEKGEVLAASSVAWSEFLTGPVGAAQIGHVERVLAGGIVPFGAAEAARAAALFNAAGRKRGTRLDSFVAATALCANASLATENGDDFKPFIASGLRLL